MKARIPISQLETLNSPLPRHGDGEASGNAKVELGTAPGGVAVGAGLGVAVGVGLGSGGMIFSQWCKGTPAPPISFTSASHFACSFSSSGGPHGVSAVPGNTK